MAFVQLVRALRLLQQCQRAVSRLNLRQLALVESAILSVPRNASDAPIYTPVVEKIFCDYRHSTRLLRRFNTLESFLLYAPPYGPERHFFMQLHVMMHNEALRRLRHVKWDVCIETLARHAQKLRTHRSNCNHDNNRLSLPNV